jgi:hypothetical protein
MFRSLGGLLYIVIGVIVAFHYGYPFVIVPFGGLVSFLLAVLLWPLVLFGANLHLAF